jgi:hypothetical protein
MGHFHAVHTGLGFFTSTTEYSDQDDFFGSSFLRFWPVNTRYIPIATFAGDWGLSGMESIKVL